MPPIDYLAKEPVFMEISAGEQLFSLMIWSVIVKKGGKWYVEGGKKMFLYCNQAHT